VLLEAVYKIALMIVNQSFKEFVKVVDGGF
jgi:hypothetical protein